MFSQSRLHSHSVSFYAGVLKKLRQIKPISQIYHLRRVSVVHCSTEMTFGE